MYVYHYIHLCWKDSLEGTWDMVPGFHSVLAEPPAALAYGWGSSVLLQDKASKDDSGAEEKMGRQLPCMGKSGIMLPYTVIWTLPVM